MSVMYNAIKKIGQFRHIIKDFTRYRSTLNEYMRQCGHNEKFRYQMKDEYMFLTDYRKPAGSVDSHYFFQDIYVAKFMATRGFKHVYDIGSRLDGYIAHLLAMGIRVTMIDVRPLNDEIDGLDFVQGNATDLNTILDESLEVLSSLHALEHFGLGRYGDPVDYNGWEKALEKMQRKVKQGGWLCVSVPIGRREKLMFNAHRIFAPETIRAVVRGGGMKLAVFAYTHAGKVVEHKFAEGEDITSYLNEVQARELADYDCGIFIFKKD